MSNEFTSPFSTRWASSEMRYIFSDDNKFKKWRKMWIVLAQAQNQLGLPVTEEQISEMEKYAEDLNLETAVNIEKEIRHDVMSHILAYGEQAKSARPIIHLGATSCYVGDNTDILVLFEAMKLIEGKLLQTMKNLSSFAIEYKGLPTLGFTHFQPAQLVTVGKRACLWLQDLLMDLEEFDFVMGSIKPRGAKGTTGTQASYLELFEGDHEKVTRLDEIICQKLGFDKSFDVTGQTYPRKLDSRILNLLSMISQSAHKFATDLRLLQNLKEIEEPFESNQVGSSAMAYKRNPMRSERICGLSRYVIANAQNGASTAAVQWFERTLDDSSNRRLSLSGAFLAVDSILNLYINITEGLVVYPKVIEKHIMEEIPFMATENILMNAVKRGGDRQLLHEKIRRYSQEAGRNVKENGLQNNLFELIENDKDFKLSNDDLKDIINPSKYIGLCQEQTYDFVENVVKKALDKRKIPEISVEINE
ncbi:MAG: adenylosuccinate lyase [Clostridia bacterium]|nr:adenylosuccinate lyase [Clostridia bacterium]